MPDSACTNHGALSQNGAHNSAGTGAGETEYYMAEQVDTGDVYHLADDAGTDNAEYTLAEEVNPSTTAGSAHIQRQVTGSED